MAIIEGLAEYGCQFHVQFQDTGLEALEIIIELVIIRIQDIIALRGKSREVLIELHIDIRDASA